MRTVSIVIKSYPKDYGFLSYCLRSLQKFARDFSEIIVMLPREHPLTLTAETVVLLDTPESYMMQQVAKMNCDQHTKADYVLHTDSDVCFTRPITPDYFFHAGKPIWTMTPWRALEPKEKRIWFHVMAKCIQECPEFEFMRKCATIVPTWLHAEFRKFIQKTHGMTMEQYVLGQPGHEFSEFNCLGFFAWQNYRDTFHWHNTWTDGVPDWPFVQRWSWGGLTDQAKAEMEAVLQ